MLKSVCIHTYRYIIYICIYIYICMPAQNRCVCESIKAVVLKRVFMWLKSEVGLYFKCKHIGGEEAGSNFLEQNDCL